MGPSSPPSKVFPQRLRAARELRGLSQGELAARAGFQSSAVSHFETGTRKPSFDNLKRLADALEVTTDYLLGRVEDPRALGHSDEPMYRHFEQLTAEDRDFAREFMESLAKRRKTRSGSED